MRPEMNDSELYRLEQRLRKAVESRQPSAPARLVDFVETVPVQSRPANRIELALGRPRVRRGALALVAAAAVVVAVAGSAVLVAYRQLPGAASDSPQVRDGWEWQATDGTVHVAELPVAHGYIATCGRQVDRQLVDQTLCSSADGLHWSTPADPEIVSLDGDGPFLPLNWVVRNGTYIATSSPGIAGESRGPATRLWRSTDGVHWAMVTLPPVLTERSMSIGQVVSDGFLAEVLSDRPEGGLKAELFISSDGLSWSKVSDMPFDLSTPDAQSYYAPTVAGLYTAGTRRDGAGIGTWRTTNGRTWDEVTLPQGYDQVAMIVELPDGSLRGIASQFDGSDPSVLVASTDGLSWQIEPTGLVGSVDVLLRTGDRLLASVSSAAYAVPNRVWQSDDWGETWRPLLDLTGSPVSGTMGVLGDRVSLADTDWIARWLLTPVEPATSQN
jgi:hypothetical protein